jgi:hypothetical protein
MTERQSPKPVFSRPPEDGAELDAWAESFVDAILGPQPEGTDRQVDPPANEP